MFLIRTAYVKYIEKKEFFLNEPFEIRNWDFRYTPGTKNVLYHSRSYNPKVQIFPIWNERVIKLLKVARLFLLGTMFLIRTTSQKMFLIRTVYVKYIENKQFSVNGHYLSLNDKISLCVRHKKCSFTDDRLISSGSS